MAQLRVGGGGLGWGWGGVSAGLACWGTVAAAACAASQHNAAAACEPVWGPGTPTPHIHTWKSSAEMAEAATWRLGASTTTLRPQWSLRKGSRSCSRGRAEVVAGMQRGRELPTRVVHSGRRHAAACRKPCGVLASAPTCSTAPASRLWVPSLPNRNSACKSVRRLGWLGGQQRAQAAAAKESLLPHLRRRDADHFVHPAHLVQGNVSKVIKRGAAHVKGSSPAACTRGPGWIAVLPIAAF